MPAQDWTPCRLVGSVYKSRAETSLSKGVYRVLAWGVQGNRLQCTPLRTGEGQIWHSARGGKNRRRDAFGSRECSKLKRKIESFELANLWGKCGRHTVEMCGKARHDGTWLWPASASCDMGGESQVLH